MIAILFVLLFAATLEAQPAVPVRLENLPIDVRCVEGCAGGGGGASTGGLTDAELRSQPVAVAGTFWPVTQPVSGIVSVSNLPATQPVTGTFFQAIQPVSGTVSVGNLPASQAVTGTFWQATQPVSGSLAVSNFPATQTVSGAVSVSNFPASTTIANFPASTTIANFPATQAVRQVKDTGRTLVALTYTATAPTTADTVVTALVKASAGVAAAGAQSITPAASRTLRLTAANAQIRTTTAALPWSVVTLRVSSTATCTAASSVVAYLAQGGTAAAIGNVGQFATQWPDGLEVPAGGSLCISVSGNVATNVLTFSAQGFEFTP